MINGDMRAFLDALFIGEDLDVMFRGRHYHIQGYYTGIGTNEQTAHVVMDDCEQTDDDKYILWEGSGDSVPLVAREFLKAKVWDGMDFNQAEREIEWID